MRKKSSQQQQSSADFQPNGEDDSESESASLGIVPLLNSESVSDDDVHTINSNDSISSSLTTSDQATPSVLAHFLVLFSNLI